MKYELTEKTVAGAQNISRMCLVCGKNNAMGLHTQFLDLEDGSICAFFSTQPEHQGYPGRVHGGIISAVIDETIGRAVQTRRPGAFGVTTELTVKFRQPVPIGEELKVVARLDEADRRIFSGTAELFLSDGTIAASGSGKYMYLEVEKIVDGGLEDADWVIDERLVPQTVQA